MIPSAPQEPPDASVPRLLVFDLDGTLIDSRRDLVECVNATLAHCHLSPLPHDQIASFIGDGAAALVSRSIERSRSLAPAGHTHAPAHDAALLFFLDFYRAHLLDHTLPYPGVVETLRTLHALPAPPFMAVLTNKPQNPSRTLCDALGLSPFLFCNYGGNSFLSKKPDPEGLRRIRQEAEALNGGPIALSQIVMVGDSEVDIRTARNAGVAAWGCTWGFATGKMLAESPDRIAHHPADWLQAFTATQQC